MKRITENFYIGFMPSFIDMSWKIKKEEDECCIVYVIFGKLYIKIIKKRK